MKLSHVAHAYLTAGQRAGVRIETLMHNAPRVRVWQHGISSREAVHQFDEMNRNLSIHSQTDDIFDIGAS